jgi:hypothetical protein
MLLAFAEGALAFGSRSLLACSAPGWRRGEGGGRGITSLARIAAAAAAASETAAKAFVAAVGGWQGRLCAVWCMLRAGGWQFRLAGRLRSGLCRDICSGREAQGVTPARAESSQCTRGNVLHRIMPVVPGLHALSTLIAKACQVYC